MTFFFSSFVPTVAALAPRSRFISWEGANRKRTRLGVSER